MARTKNPSAATVKAWKTRRRAAAKSHASATVAARAFGIGEERRRSDEHELASGKPTGYDPFDGGMSESYKVDLDNGRQGCFKISDKGGGVCPGIRGKGAERELAAWEIAKLVGMDDMMGAVVIRELNVPGRPGWSAGTKRGSLAEWRTGRVSFEVAASESFGSDASLKRAAMFDFIIGNQDRHDGNWLVADGGEISLIDHNLSFGTLMVGDGATRLLLREMRARETANKHTREGEKPYPDTGKPSAIAGAYTKNKTAILDVMRKLRFSPNAVAQVDRRIDFAASAETWRALFDGG